MSSKPDYKREIEANVAEEKRQGRLDYDKTAFILKTKSSNDVHRSPFKIKNREQHREVIEYALKNGLYLWYAAVTIVHGKTHADPPHIIDWDSVPGAEQQSRKNDDEPKKEYPDDLKCAKCGHKCSSPSGYTLHMKSHERDEAEGDPALRCPVCSHQCSSTSGLTLHKKKHENIGAPT